MGTPFQSRQTGRVASLFDLSPAGIAERMRLCRIYLSVLDRLGQGVEAGWPLGEVYSTCSLLRAAFGIGRLRAQQRSTTATQSSSALNAVAVRLQHYAALLQHLAAGGPTSALRQAAQVILSAADADLRGTHMAATADPSTAGDADDLLRVAFDEEVRATP